MADESGFQIERGAPHFYEQQVAALMAPFVAALVDATVQPGESVLDVACGTGFATRAAAAIAGAGARVDGSDLNPAMVSQARSVPDDSGADVAWREASALDLPYADDEFDAVICQQGLQFFPDPAAGLREMARVTHPEGRIGVTVWAPREQSPFLDRETDMLARVMGESHADWSTTESQLRSWFRAGGLGDVVVRHLTFDVDLPAVRTYVPEHLKALPWSAGFLGLPERDQQAALDVLDAELAEYRTADGLRVPFSSFLASASV